MKSKVFSVTSVEQIEPRLQDIREEGLAPDLAIVLSSVVHNLKELSAVFLKYDIEVFGASSRGEITNDEIHEESIAVMLLEITRNRKVHTMPLYQITIEIQENKIDEFCRSLHSLWFRFLKEEGCLSYRVYREFERENTFCMVGEFTTHEALENHFQTRDFEVLVGAASVLGNAFKMMIT